MAVAVYALGILVTALCAMQLMSAYGRDGQRLLFWVGLGFICLTVANILVIDDLLIWPNVNLYPLRLSAAAVGMLLLLYGLISESS